MAFLIAYLVGGIVASLSIRIFLPEEVSERRGYLLAVLIWPLVVPIIGHSVVSYPTLKKLGGLSSTAILSVMSSFATYSILTNYI